MHTAKILNKKLSIVVPANKLQTYPLWGLLQDTNFDELHSNSNLPDKKGRELAHSLALVMLAPSLPGTTIIEKKKVYVNHDKCHVLMF